MAGVRLLSLDTSSVVSVALLEVSNDAEPVIVSEMLGTDTHRHAEDLVPAVRDALAAAGWERPDAILVGEGPGPFTGLRGGLASADVLAFAWGVPVYGLCSLDGLAQQLAPAAGGEFVAALDARRKELYWGRYDAAGRPLGGPQVGAVETLPAGLPVAGAGVRAREAELASAGASLVAGTEDTPVSAAHLALAWLAAGRPQHAPAARYLRESDAVAPASLARPAGGAK